MSQTSASAGATGRFARPLAWAFEPASWPVLAIVLLLLLLAFYLPLSAWTSNEENYFQLAYRRVAPEAFTPWSAVFDQSSGRLVSEYLYGTLVEQLGYDRAHTVARLATAGLYAVGLGAMLSSMRVSVVEALAIVGGFHMLNEHILGGEWLFLGTEPKTWAYGCVFLAIGLAQRGRWRWAFVATAVATWLHFLVGGFWALALALASAISTPREWRRAAGAFGLYVLLIAPLLVIVARDQFAPGLSAAPWPAADAPGALSADTIYAWRNAHHLSPFINPALMPQWMRGIARLAAVVGVYLLLLLLLRGRPRGSLLIPLVGIGLVELVLALGVSYLDRDRTVLAKLYMFRPSSATLLLFLALLVIGSRDVFATRYRSIVGAALIVVAVGGLLLEIQRDVRQARQPASVPHQAELVEAVRAASGPDEVVLLDPSMDDDVPVVRLNRLVERPTVVATKFVPTAPDDVRRWHALLQWRAGLFEKGCRASDMQAVPVKLLIAFSASARDRVEDCGPVIWQRDDIALIRVQR